MLRLFRRARLVLAAILLAAGVQAPALAALTAVSGSGNLQFDILSASYLSGSTQQVEVIAVGQDAFRIQAVGGGPLVAAGDNLSLLATVTALSGSIEKWTGQLIGTTGGSMGESIEDIGQTLGLGLITLSGNIPNGSVAFAPQTGLFITKDINGLAQDGAIEAVIQGLEFVNDPPAVPEPLTLALFGTGLLGLAAVRRRRPLAA